MNNIQDSNNLLKYLEEFVSIYLDSPIENNDGGMGFNHSYFTYYVLKEINPKLVVESGVWKGHSTYLIEKALPSCELICLDINFEKLIYKSEKATYFDTDFRNVDWSSVKNIDDSICFFDDHQNSLERLKEMKWWGFKKGIFEDNFPVGEGDSYSLKQIIKESGHPSIELSKKYLPKTRKAKNERRLEEKLLNKYYFRQNMIVRPNVVDSAGFHLNVKELIEFPPVFSEDVSYWGEPWSGNYEKLDDLILDKNINEYPNFESFIKNKNSRFDYGFITYLELQ